MKCVCKLLLYVCTYNIIYIPIIHTQRDFHIEYANCEFRRFW